MQKRRSLVTAARRSLWEANRDISFQMYLLPAYRNEKELSELRTKVRCTLTWLYSRAA